MRYLCPVMLHLAEMLAKTEPMIKCNGTPFGTHFTPFQDTPRKLPTAFKLCAINHIHSIKPHDDLRIGGYEVTHNGLISIWGDPQWVNIHSEGIFLNSKILQIWVPRCPVGSFCWHFHISFARKGCKTYEKVWSRWMSFNNEMVNSILAPWIINI